MRQNGMNIFKNITVKTLEYRQIATHAKPLPASYGQRSGTPTMKHKLNNNKVKNYECYLETNFK